MNWEKIQGEERKGRK